jgi:tetratricopeptide (TPR) repeat protein
MKNWPRTAAVLLPALFMLSLALSAQRAEAQGDPSPEPEASETPVDETTQRALAAYKRGHVLAKKEQWGDALAAFEEAAAAKDKPLVQYNIVYCQRALGRYVAARRTARRILAAPEGLADSYLGDLRSFVGEFDQIIVAVEVTLEPGGAALTVDGRPLVKEGIVYLGGVAGGDASAVTPSKLTVEVDPGSHLFRAQRKGHQDVVVQRSFAPGERAQLPLRLDEMPATIVVKASEQDAIVRVDEREVGLAPIEFQRPAGSYRLKVEKEAFEPYSAELQLEAGQRTELTAEMLPYEQPLHEKWWFWTAIGGAVTAGVVLTVVLTRPEPEPPPYQTGNTGWLVEPSGFRF